MNKLLDLDQDQDQDPSLTKIKKMDTNTECLGEFDCSEKSENLPSFTLILDPDWQYKNIFKYLDWRNEYLDDSSLSSLKDKTRVNFPI